MFKGYEEITALNDKERKAVEEATTHDRLCRPALYGAAAKTYVGRLLNGYTGCEKGITVSIKGSGAHTEASLMVQGKVVETIPVAGRIYQSLDRKMFQKAVDDVVDALK